MGRLFVLFLVGTCGLNAFGEPVKVACVGDSITWGAAIREREFNAYPVVLQRMLGGSYEVVNYGVSGRCLLRKADPSYWDHPAFKDALKFAPDLVVIKLGSNDAKAHQWVYKDEFESDYEALMDAFLAVNPDVMFVLVMPVPLLGSQPRGHDAELLREGIYPRIRTVAGKREVPLLDLSPIFEGNARLYADFIHPNAEGAFVIASEVCRVIRFGSASE